MTSSDPFEQLKHPNPHLRSRAIDEIIEHQDETTVPRLLDALGEADTTYRRAAVKVLGVVGLQTVPRLVELMLNSDNVTVRGSAAKALAQVALNYPETPFPQEGLDGLKTALNDVNPVVYIAASMALGVIGEPALDGLFEVFNSTENLGLAVAIINAISSIESDRSLEFLQQTANDKAADGYLQETATSALSRLELVRSQLTRQ